MEPVETIEHKGFTIKIIWDDFPSNPLEDWDWEPGTHMETSDRWGGTIQLEGDEMPAWEEHEYETWNANVYGVEKCAAKQAYIAAVNWGDKDEFEIEEGALEMITLQDCVNCENRCEELKEWREDNVEYWAWKKEVSDFFATHTVLQVHKYEHSGVAYNTTGFDCPWDSGPVGYVSARNDIAVDDVTKYLKHLVNVFSLWANGNVYGYVVEDADGEVVDSCWGFYAGYEDEEWKYMISEATKAADWAYDELWEGRKSAVRIFNRKEVA